MTKEIYDAYIADGWHLFKLIKVEDGGNAVKGRYMTPKGWNDLSKPSASHSNKAIYGGLPPEGMVAIDWDEKNGKRGLNSFEKLQSDLGIELETVVSTPSGGGHCYAWLPGAVKLKKTQKEYPDIEFQSHGSEFVVLGGQEVEGYGEYAFTDPDFGYFVNSIPELCDALELRGERVEIDPDDIDVLEHLSSRPSLEEVEDLLSRISPDLGHDEGWQQVIMSLNSWDMGGEEGLRLAMEWSKQAENYALSDEQLEAKYEACRSTTPDFYQKLYSLANDSDEGLFEKWIEQAETDAELSSIADRVANSYLDNKTRVELADKLANKEKEEGLTARKSKKKWADMVAKAKAASEIDDEKIKDTRIYLCDSKYVIRHGVKVIENVGAQALGKYLSSFNIPKDSQEHLTKDLEAIEDVRYRPDYLIDTAVAFDVTHNRGTKLPSFVIKNNPVVDVGDYIHDEDVLEDFLLNVWAGKIEDIVRLVALTIKTKETKLNRLMVVAPSNVGKTVLFDHLGFQKITMPRLINGMRGDKGIGPQVIDGIRQTGLLLIDEANKSLEAEIKDMDKELHVDQFGTGGTQVLQLYFTALTSTHKTATRNNSDELYNRFLQIELKPSEVKHTLMQSPVFLKDPSHYTVVVRSFLLSLFRETLLNDEGENELKELQERYRLPMNNDLDALLFEISEAFIDDIRNIATADGEVATKAGEYYCKNKRIVSDFVSDRLGEVPSLDTGKYTELLTDHFLPEERGSVRLENGVKKMYHLHMRPFNLDKENNEENVKEMFEDLEDEL